MDVKQNEKEMMEWFDKHKSQYLTTSSKKRRAVIPTKQSKKEKEWAKKPAMPKKIHYGGEWSKDLKLVKEFHRHGHTISLWNTGLLTCNCKGWVFKREGAKRECICVRETYAKLTGKKVPDKTKVSTAELFDKLIYDLSSIEDKL